MKRRLKVRETEIIWPWPNSHARHHLCLTPKEIAVMVKALRAIAYGSSKYSERLYLEKMVRKIRGQLEQT